VRFEETFRIQLVKNGSLRTAQRLRELLRETSDDDNVEMDLVFTLFGKDGSRPVQALGEAYVNLREMAISGSDLTPPDALEILNTKDKVVGRLSVSVTALEAFKKLSEPQPASRPPPAPIKPQAISETPKAHREEKAANSSASGPAGETAAVIAQQSQSQAHRSEPQKEPRRDLHDATPPKQVTLDSLLAGSGPPSPDLPLDARHTEADFEVKERRGLLWDDAGEASDAKLDKAARHAKAVPMKGGSDGLNDRIAAPVAAGRGQGAAAAAVEHEQQEEENYVGDFELDA
jgi:hypothetical protein